MRTMMSGGLLRDRFIQVSIAAYVLLALPYVLPLLTEAQLWTYAVSLVEIPLLVLAIVASQKELGHLTDLEERKFWNLITAGLVFWLIQDLLSLKFMPTEDSSIVVELTRNALYFGFYLFFAISLETRPHASVPLTGKLRAFDHIGAFVFLFGQLLYFAVIPSLVDLQAYWSSSLLLYVVLDGYLVVRLGGFRRQTADPVWRTVYFWLWLCALWWLVTDSIEMLMWSELIPYVESGTLLDLVWWPPLLLLVLAARSRHLPAREGHRREVPPPELVVVGPLVIYAMVFPLIHFIAYSSGLADPALEKIRGWTSLCFFLLLMAMTFAYQELLRKETRRLDEERREAQALVEHQAYHDYLTGLPNRLLLADHLHLAMANARRFSRPLAVLFVDLDRFKVVNDSLGHAAGDQLLVEVSRRLQKICRPGDTVARLGGDEFVVLVDGLSQMTDGAIVARKVLAAFETPFSVADREIPVTTSVGVAVFPGDGKDGEQLLRNADVAMYQAKRVGRGSYRLFASAMNEEAVARIAFEESLSLSMVRSELFLVYQPIVDLESTKPVGVEALLRWQHPERGVVGPDSFIRIAESTGLIRPIGKMVFETACRQWVVWHEGGRELTMAVNLSIRQLESLDFLDEVAACLASSGADPTCIEVEITESMAIEHAQEIVPCLEGLRDMGLKVSLDDFGTKYSSLSRLLELPIDKLKIDRSFVAGVDQDTRWSSVVRAVLTMARELGLVVVAEGVERESQRRTLLECGCVLGQGYFFSRPRSADEVVV